MKLNKVTLDAASRIDGILHRNRSILLEIMGKEGNEKRVNRSILDSKKFNFSYVTQLYMGAHDQIVSFVYDFSWILSKDQEVLIRRIGVMDKQMSRAA